MPIFMTGEKVFLEGDNRNEVVARVLKPAPGGRGRGAHVTVKVTDHKAAVGGYRRFEVIKAHHSRLRGV